MKRTLLPLAVPLCALAGISAPRAVARADGTFTAGGIVTLRFKGVAGQSSIGRSADGSQQRGLLFVVANAPVNRVPAAQTTPEDTPLVFSGLASPPNGLSVSDADNTPLAVTLSVTHGTLTLSRTTGLAFDVGVNGSGAFQVSGSQSDLNAALEGLRFDPTPNFNSPAGSADNATLLISASDGVLSDQDAITIAISAVNDAPVAAADAYNVSGGSLAVPARGVLQNDTDIDGNALLASLKSVPQHGTLSFQTDGSFVYTPAVSYAGPDSFTYAASDGQIESAPTTVTLAVRSASDTTPPSLVLAGGALRVEQRLIPLRGAAADVYVLKSTGPVVASGLKSVVVRLQRFGGDYYNGKSYQKAPVDLPTQQLGRSFFTVPQSAMPPLSLAPGGRYKWTAIARDNAGNTTQAVQFMLVDASAPSVVISTPQASSDNIVRVPKLGAVAGRVSEPAAISLILRRSDGQYWNGRAYQTAFTFQSVRSAGGLWSFPASSLPSGQNLPPGRYTIEVRGSDAAGNVGSAKQVVVVQSRPAS